MDSNADLQRPPKLYQEPKPPMTEEEEKAYLREEIAQLKKELAIEREKISTTALDLVMFTVNNGKNDQLLTPKSDPPANPWAKKPKSCCIIL